jgi:dTDP-4-dehydrorhamnose 3,5-epimerase
MNFIQTYIKDLIYIEPSAYEDARGFFYESYNKEQFDIGIGKDVNFVQDNHSSSCKNVIRGIHLQKSPYAQGKLVRVVKGSILDIAIDLRKDSPTFMQYFSIELNESNKKQLWIPEGFGHAFLSLSDDANLVYKTTSFYNKDSEITIAWNDPDLKIKWPIKLGDIIISDKDKIGISIEDYIKY